MNLELFDASFVVLLCFLLFMFSALKYGYRKSISALDNQISEIKRTLDQAGDKVNQAQNRLQQEKLTQSELSKEVEHMIEEANHRIESIKNQSAQELLNLIDSRQRTVDQMMDQIRLKTINDLKLVLTDQIQVVLEDLMLHRLDAKTHEDLNQDAISQLILVLKEDRKGKHGSSSSKEVTESNDAPLFASGR